MTAELVGVFGGTFDPIHFGHLRPALELLQALRLRELRLIPSARPPHREPPVASAEARLRMVQAAARGVHGFVVDDREYHRQGPSYTVDTLASLHEELGDVHLCLAIGTDGLASFTQWHEWERILTLAHLVVAHRPGSVPQQDAELPAFAAPRAARSVEDLRAQPAGCILFQPVTQLAISSTGIRELLAAGRSPRYLLPDAVLELIQTEGLYPSATSVERRDA